MNTDFDIIPELTFEEIKQKYIRTKGVSFANPPCYDSSKHHRNKQYINIDYELEDFYNNL